jgi:hypothetical protein
MTVHLVAPNGRSTTVYIPSATSENNAIRAAQVGTGRDWQPAWVLPGDVR